MSRTGFWLTVVAIVVGSAMTVETIVKFEWIRSHPWIAWPLWCAAGVSAFMAARETDGFRRATRKVLEKIVPPPRSAADSKPQIAAILPIPEAKRRLEITITEAVTSLAPNDHTRLWLLLNVHVNGPTVKVTNWALTLKYGGGARVALQIPTFKKKPYYLPDPKQHGEIVEVEPIKQVLPGSGWILFSVIGLSVNDPWINQIFGATLVLTAVEENERRTSSTTEPGPWLRRATQIWMPGDPSNPIP